MVNQNPEQIARDKIDTLLEKAGWVVQDRTEESLAIIAYTSEPYKVRKNVLAYGWFSEDEIILSYESEVDKN